ncbi:MAG TPA: alpha/beta hydrolase [Caulobacter sp.]|nr:alpha/beta hydrolase [Caulobacter sp.]
MRAWMLPAAFGLAVLASPAAGAGLMGVPCRTPAPVHCAPGGCTPTELGDTGNAVEPVTGRKFFLDYPCDLKPGEKVTFVLSLHGGGSIGNWQRHYFPLLDLKEKYRLVVATPTGTQFGWKPEADDAYLQGIVEAVEAALGPDRIRAFWLAGHSLGGQTSNRLLATPFYRSRLTGWVSLSGGRLGSRREDVRAPIPAGVPLPPGAGPGPPRLVADASLLPDFPFSHIYATGEHELTAAGLPESSRWAERLGCGPRAPAVEVVDTRAGYVEDSRPQANPNPIWGLKARPGTARLYRYPACREGRVVADVVRLDKGHTEGLEPHITEQIVKLMLSAGPGR